MAEQGKKALSPWWRNSAIIVMILGFSVLLVMTVLTYRSAPPIASKVVGPGGKVVYTGDTIRAGQEVFLKYALMEHGTLWGHGAYLGPDYSAEYLHRAALVMRDHRARELFNKAFADLSGDQAAAVSDYVKKTLRENRYDPDTDTLSLTAGQVAAFRDQIRFWTDYFHKENGAPGLPAKYIQDPDEIKDLTAYLGWAAWATTAARPGEDHSYTNNFPYEPLAGNQPTPSTYMWSAISLLFLLGGLGLVLFVFGKFSYLGWKGDGDSSHPHPVKVLPITGSQWAVGAFIAVVALLFLLQTLAGGALAHFRVEPNGFYGFDLAKLLPYNLLRTWHLQLAIFWIATAWVAGGLFLAVSIGGKEPKGQKVLAYVLLGALTVVVLGSMFGEYLGINDKLGDLWFWLGHQGSEYLDLGRFWQVLLASGLIFWLWLMFRALLPAIRDPKRSELSSLFLFAAVAIPVFYVPAFFYGAHTNFAVIDHWRFWIIHLWVEGFFELFATVLVAIMFVQLGLVSTQSATRIIYLDAILYLTGGILGIAHHWYFTGQSEIAMALGACFSALEVVPLTLLTLDAWDFIRLGRSRPAGGEPHPAMRQKWAIYFLVGVGFWNFVGAGVFGFLINLPIVSYFEIGTTLTANHGHAAMFGVFGMLALAVLVYVLRELQTDETWKRSERFIRTGFWGLQIGLGLMLVLDLFPAGVIQLWDVVSNSYWHARQPEFTQTGAFHVLEWIRIAGDLVFLLAGVVPMVLGTLIGFVRRDAARA
ncbi:MAG: nitric-oxide reductase large subunit [Deltaproteobacteria bacterium]|nr:nitric-oxide reductase large subunit [Deltaproteobacteria bacterium]